MSAYRKIRNSIARLGYAALPLTERKGEGSKEPGVAFGWLTRASKESVIEEIKTWDSPLASALWLLDAMPGSGAPDLDVLDYDDLADKPWGVATFGSSPLTQISGRDGGGEHHFFRRDPTRPRDENGSIPKFVSGKAVDWKTWHGYVVAPGSLHRTGRTYQLYWEGKAIQPADLTVEMLNSLPVLDREAVDLARGVGVTDATYVEMGFDKTTTRLRTYTTGGGKLPKEKAEASAVVPAGAWKGMSVEAVARSIGTGDDGIGCPHAAHGNAHKTDINGGESARLHVEGGAPAYLVCFACSKVYTYGKHETSGQHFPTTSKNGCGARKVLITSDHLTASGHLGIDLILNAPETKGRSVLVLQAGRGGGKTTLAAEVVHRVKPKGAWPVAVSPTRSLTSALSAVMKLPHYEATTERNVTTPLAVCLPSLPRVATLKVTEVGMEDVGADVLVLEEVEQQIRTLAGSHLDDWQATRAWHALVHQVRHAKLVLMLDADAGALTEHLLRVAGRLDATVWFHGRDEAPRDFVFYDQAARWHADLAAAIAKGERPYVYVQSVAEAETLAKMYPDLTLVTGGERGTVGDFDLAKINEWAAKGAGLVTTPALGTGVSIDVVDCFDHVWVYGNDSLCTADDVLQGINRPRHPKSKVVRAYFRSGRKPAAWEKDPEQVLAVWMGRSEATKKLTGFSRELPNDLVVYDEGLPVANPGAASYARAMALAYAEGARKGRGWTETALVERVRELGGRTFRVEAAPATPAVKAVTAARKAAREEVDEERVEAVVCAPELTEEQVATVKRRGPRTRDEALGMHRLAVERFYGTVNEAVVEYDDDGRGRTAARALAHVEAVRDGGTARSSVERMDQREVGAGVSLPRQRHALLRARGTLAVLKRAGLDGVLAKWAKLLPEEFTAGTADTPKIPTAAYRPVFLDDAKVQALGEWAATPNGSRFLTYLGITVRRDVATNPTQLVGSVLRVLGLKLHAMKEGNTRRYFVDFLDYCTVRKMAGAYEVRLASGMMLGLHVEDLDDLDAADMTPSGSLSPEMAEALLAEAMAA